MSIVTVEKDGNCTYKYKEPESTYLYDQLTALLDIFDEFIESSPKYSVDDIAVDEVIISEALVRVDKRRDYFVIYHEDTEINEIKESALICYWLLKFKPFHVISTDEDVRAKYESLNESFALFVLLSTIKEKANRDPDMEFFISREYVKKISYAFKYWDLSKEAIILISETLCEAMYIRKEKNV